MKTIQVTLRETGDGRTLRVESFSNTAELVCGQLILREVTRGWSHPKMRVSFKVLPKIETEEDRDLLAVPHECALPVTPPAAMGEDAEACRINGADFEPGGNSQVRKDAKKFDEIALELCALNSWIPESLLADAMLPDPGNDNLGTVGIKGKIARHSGLSLVRRTTAREIGFSSDTIGGESERAAALPVLQKFAALLLPKTATENEPF